MFTRTRSHGRCRGTRMGRYLYMYCCYNLIFSVVTTSIISSLNFCIVSSYVYYEYVIIKFLASNMNHIFM